MAAPRPLPSPQRHNEVILNSVYGDLEQTLLGEINISIHRSSYSPYFTCNFQFECRGRKISTSATFMKKNFILFMLR
jgi:hypothetical protein